MERTACKKEVFFINNHGSSKQDFFDIVEDIIKMASLPAGNVSNCCKEKL